MTAITSIAPLDIVMIADIADRMEVSKAAVQGWMRRDGFPEPIVKLRAGQVYDYGAIYLWRQADLAARRERLERAEGTLR